MAERKYEFKRSSGDGARDGEGCLIEGGLEVQDNEFTMSSFQVNNYFLSYSIQAK